MPDILITEPVAIFLTIIAVILITPLISERFRLPGIVGLLIGGILIGPNGFHLLDVSDSIVLLSTVGLIYLMFSAGLEVNLHQFNRVRNKSLIFGVFTYFVPQLMGLLFGRLLGMGWLGSVLLGSAFSSHTLLAFPVLTRLGIVKNEPISITVGATIFTDITAFIVLAAAISLQGGTLEPVYFLKLFGMLGAFAAFVLLILPRIGKFFFKHFHHITVEFQFVLVALFISAIMAEIIGVHAVVGAFLAGLAINATLPHRSPVINHVLFLGESFFIPIFLIYSGMITNVGIFLAETDTILIGVGMTFIAYFSKFVAAWIFARLFKYSRDELFTVWGLSQAQAAVTIPTLIIGVELGLFSETVFNAAIMMVVLTSITSPLLVQKFGRMLTIESESKGSKPLFSKILVPVANPDTRNGLIELGALLCGSVQGTLFPLNIAVDIRGEIQGLEHQQKLLEGNIFDEINVEYQNIKRIDGSIARGIIRTSLEKEASLILMGWNLEPRYRNRIFNNILDEVIWHASIPVMLARLKTHLNAMKRIVVIIPPQRQVRTIIEKTLSLAISIGQSLNIPLFFLTSQEFVDDFNQAIKLSGGEHPSLVVSIDTKDITEINKYIHDSDLAIVPTFGSRNRFRESLGYLTEEIAVSSRCSIAVIHFPSAKYENKIIQLP